MSLVRRFLQIERPRAGAPDAEPDEAVARRIEGVERPSVAPEPPPRSGGDLERFAPPPPPPLELDVPEAGERPFTRCPRCGMDHHVGIVACSACGAPLDTEACRAFNDALWRERLAQAAEEDRVDAARRAAREAAEGEAAREQRAAAEAMAREIGEAERRRLDRELGPGGEVLRAGQRLIDWLTRGR